MDFPHRSTHGAAHKTCRPAATWRSTWRPNIFSPRVEHHYPWLSMLLWAFGGTVFCHFLEPRARSWWISDGICWWNRGIWMWSLMKKMPQINPSNHGRYECTGPSASRISFSVKLATGHACRFFGFNKFNGFNQTRQCKLYKVVLPSHKVVYNPHENCRYIMIYYL